MQTERVTFLTSPDHKAALDAYAARNGKSVGHLLREASTKYLAEGAADEEEALTLLAREVEEAVPQMRADIQEAVHSIERANRIVDAILSRGDQRS
jgi:hypothetical protein